MLREIKDREQWGPLDGVLLYPTLFHRSVCTGARKNWGAGWTEIIGFYSHKRGTYIWEKSDMVKGGYGVIRDRLMVPAKKQELW